MVGYNLAKKNSTNKQNFRREKAIYLERVIEHRLYLSIKKTTENGHSHTEGILVERLTSILQYSVSLVGHVALLPIKSLTLTEHYPQLHYPLFLLFSGCEIFMYLYICGL